MDKYDSYMKIHFDYHTPPNVDLVASNFDVDRFFKKLSEIGCQAFNFFAKDLFGNCYWETKVGHIHPYLKRDLLKEVTETAKEYGIKVIAYYNVMDLRNIELHPSWKHKGSPKIHGSEGNFVCFNSPWTEKVFLPELKELSRYDIYGIFFDFLYVRQPCYCKWCRDRFYKEHGYDIPEDTESPRWKEYTEWWRSIGREIREKALKTIHSVNPNIKVGVNWSYTTRQPEIPPEDIGFLTLDINETSCPVLNASYHSKYLNTLGKPFDIMTTRFLKWWGDWGLKPLKTMEIEVATVMANGGLTVIGDHFYVDGSFEEKILDTFGKLFNFIKSREMFVKDTESAPYIAVLHSMETGYSRGMGILADEKPIRGSHKILLENNLHFDIVNEYTLLKNIDQYTLIILPSQRYLPRNLTEKIKEFVKKSGYVIATYDTSLKKSKFESDTADVVAYRLNPYIVEGEEDWSKWLGAGYGSPILDKEYPAITINEYGEGKASYIATELFASYFQYNNWLIRKIVKSLIEKIIPDTKKIIEVSATPTVEVTLRKRRNEYIIHLVSWHTEKIYSMPTITEKIPTVENINIKLKLDHKPEEIITYPSDNEIEWSYKEKILMIKLPKLQLHTIIDIKTT